MPRVLSNGHGRLEVNLTFHQNSPNESMGLGWEVMNGPAADPVILLHTGSDAGIKTMILLLPASKRGIVIFTNGERGMEVVTKILHSALHMRELDH